MKKEPHEILHLSIDHDDFRLLYFRHISDSSDITLQTCFRTFESVPLQLVWSKLQTLHCQTFRQLQTELRFPSGGQVRTFTSTLGPATKLVANSEQFMNGWDCLLAELAAKALSILWVLHPSEVRDSIAVAKGSQPRLSLRCTERKTPERPSEGLRGFAYNQFVTCTLQCIDVIWCISLLCTACGMSKLLLQVIEVITGLQAYSASSASADGSGAEWWL